MDEVNFQLELIRDALNPKIRQADAQDFCMWLYDRLTSRGFKVFFGSPRRWGAA
jgi:hypothetical protein